VNDSAGPPWQCMGFGHHRCPDNTGSSLVCAPSPAPASGAASPLGVPDQLQWRWSPNGTYSSRSAYAALMFEQLVIPGARELWKTHAPNKCRFFIWLVLLRRCWTADRRFRRGLQADNSCALCSQEPELVDHLVFQCVFSREVWFSALRRCG
jgi:hypothetical protein